MIRFLPFILVAVLVLGGLGYWRFVASKPTLPSPQVTGDSSDQIQFPVTGSDATLEEKVKILEEIAKKLVAQVNLLKATKSAINTTEINDLNTAVSELKIKVAALENTSPVTTTTTTTSSKSTVYIPLGSGGGPWNNQDWYSTDYLVSLDPANYPGYSGMYLEGVFRLTSAVGTASLRLYNSTDNSAVSPEISTTSTTFTLKTSTSFKLPSGSKNYVLQVKSSSNQDMQIQSARIKVNF